MGQSRDNTRDRCTSKADYQDWWLSDVREATGQADYSIYRYSIGKLGNHERAVVEHLASEKFTTAVILLCGAPPPHPVNHYDLTEFGVYIHDLSVWSQNARESLFKLWGIAENDYENDVLYRVAFDECLQAWYNMEYEEVDDAGQT